MNENRLLGSWLIASIFIIVFGGFQLVSVTKDYNEQLQANEHLLADLNDHKKLVQRLNADLQKQASEIREVSRESIRIGWIARDHKGMTLDDLLEHVDKK